MPCDFRDGMIICSRGPAKKRCAYCERDSSKLCDYPLKSGKTCDSPMCTLHTWSPEPNTDYCRHHRAKIEEPEREAKLKAEKAAKQRDSLIFIAQSKYPGSCKDKDCGARWDAGDPMYWDKETREVFCAECGEMMR